jgi:hypothetical protein
MLRLVRAHGGARTRRTTLAPVSLRLVTRGETPISPPPKKPSHLRPPSTNRGGNFIYPPTQNPILFRVAKLLIRLNVKKPQARQGI